MITRDEFCRQEVREPIITSDWGELTEREIDKEAEILFNLLDDSGAIDFNPQDGYSWNEEWIDANDGGKLFEEAEKKALDILTGIEDGILDDEDYSQLNKLRNELVITYDGKWIDFEGAMNIADRDICEELHTEMAPCTFQQFYEAYCEAHLEKYGEEFPPDCGGKW